MAKDYVGLVKRVENYNSIKTELHKEYKDGYISIKDFQSELEVNKAKLRNLLEVAKAEGGIASEVLSGKGTLEDFVSYHYKEVRGHVKGFKYFKKFQPNEKRDERTKLILRELYDNYDSGQVKHLKMLTENIKNIEKTSLFNPKRYSLFEGMVIGYGSFCFCFGTSIFLSGNILEINNEKFLGGFCMLLGSLVAFQGITKNLNNSVYRTDQDNVLSRLKDESASMVVKARIFDDVVKDVYSDMKK